MCSLSQNHLSKPSPSCNFFSSFVLYYIYQEIWFNNYLLYPLSPLITLTNQEYRSWGRCYVLRASYLLCVLMTNFNNKFKNSENATFSKICWKFLFRSKGIHCMDLQVNACCVKTKGIGPMMEQSQMPTKGVISRPQVWLYSTFHVIRSCSSRDQTIKYWL